MFRSIIASLVVLFILPFGAEAGNILKRDDEAKRKTLCASQRHVPRDDVAYQPGVSVTGKMVAPADLNASPIRAPESFSFPITRDLAQLLPVSSGPYELEATFGAIEARRNRAGGYDLFYEGQPLQPTWESALKEFCGELNVRISE